MGKEKDKKKDSQLVIRIDKQEKKRFLKLCEARETTAGREIRRFIQDTLAAQEPPAVTAAAEPEAQPETAPELPQDPAPKAAKPAKAKTAKPKAVKVEAEKVETQEAEKAAP